MGSTRSGDEADRGRYRGRCLAACRKSLTPTPPQATTRTTGENVSTEPFTSRRDKSVADLRARVEAMQQALDRVKARGPQETEIEPSDASDEEAR